MKRFKRAKQLCWTQASVPDPNVFDRPRTYPTSPTSPIAELQRFPTATRQRSARNQTERLDHVLGQSVFPSSEKGARTRRSMRPLLGGLCCPAQQHRTLLGHSRGVSERASSGVVSYQVHSVLKKDAGACALPKEDCAALLSSMEPCLATC
jgi:hypothetical protein